MSDLILLFLTQIYTGFTLIFLNDIKEKLKMKNFHDGYRKFCSKSKVSKELKPLLSIVYNQIQANTVNLQLLKELGTKRCPYKNETFKQGEITGGKVK